jgi:protoporphyrin/coproporphyrin ferrochelatase
MSIYGAASVDAPRYDDVAKQYDAILVMSFGGPEGMDDVMPFLEQVSRGRNIPRERLEAVAEHYYEFDGVSPINQQNRDLIDAMHQELQRRGHTLPIYFGNRNWHPFVTDTIKAMQADGVTNAVAFMTSGYSCYSGCRQYREDIIGAIESVPGAPSFDKIRVFYNHPRFINALVDLTTKAIAHWSDEMRRTSKLIFTAHSIPTAMAQKSAYEAQLHETSRIVSERLGYSEYILSYQSRSGAPHIPWLEPDIADVLHEQAEHGVKHVIVIPIGFISDHMEVINDLDHEAKEAAVQHGQTFIRVPTVGLHPEFVGMIVDLIEERMQAQPVRHACGNRPANHDICPVNCCLRG